MKSMRYVILFIIVMFVYLLFAVVEHYKYLNSPENIIIGKVERIGVIFFDSFIEFTPIDKISYDTEEKMYADVVPYSSAHKMKKGDLIKIRYITNSDGSISRYVVCPNLKDGIVSVIMLFFLLTVPIIFICVDNSSKGEF